MSYVYITDYVENPDIEKKVLGNSISKKINKDVKVLLAWHKKIDSSYLDNFPNLVGIVRYGVGIDSIDLEEIKKRKLILCNTPDYGVDEVSDTAVAMIMNIQRGISRYDYECRDYKDSWEINTISSLKRTSSTNIGVIGAGIIGSSVIIKTRSIGFNVSFYDPFKESGYEKTLKVSRHYDLNSLLTTSDIISIHVPLNRETYGMVNKDFLSQMKKGASIINTSRGNIIPDLNIIYEGLRSGQIGCVAFDVLASEPPKNEELIKVWRKRESSLSSRIIINPHTSYYSQESFIEMRKSASEVAKEILEGSKKPRNIILDAR
tara:strand:- start:1242 stop:2198 length:957 start_codon:yes stop_codon:yes gene_type:complete